jgi:hypothetical protein
MPPEPPTYPEINGESIQSDMLLVLERIPCIREIKENLN